LLDTEVTSLYTAAVSDLNRLLDATDEPFDDAVGDDDAVGPPTQRKVPTIAPQATTVEVDEGSTRHEPVFAGSHAKDKWYLRVQLRKDCLANLWIHDQTPHNVLAWSDGMESWVPLLTVPELREAIREAQDKKTRDLLTHPPPPVLKSTPPSEGRLPLPPPRCAGSVVYAAPARAAKFWSMPHPHPVSTRPPPVPSTVPAPPPHRNSTVPPAVRNSVVTATTTHPISTFPASMDVPTIPRPAKVPEFIETVPSALESARVANPEPRAPRSAVPIHGTLTPPAMTVVPPAGTHRSLVLLNLERVLWLAAGVSVATAFFIVLRAQDGTPGNAAGKPLVSAAIVEQQVESTNSSKAIAVKRTTKQSEPKSDTASVEDLPLVGKRGASRDLGKVAGQTRAISPASPKLTTGSEPSLPQVTGGSESPSPKVTTVAAPANRPAPTSEGAFNPGQARRVLGSAASRAQSCAEGPVSGSVQVTFAPSGFVQNAVLSSIAGENVRSACVLRAFQEARVSPFSGAPIAVKKSF
jgi:hypothetical protein